MRMRDKACASFVRLGDTKTRALKLRAARARHVGAGRIHLAAQMLVKERASPAPLDGITYKFL